MVHPKLEVKTQLSFLAGTSSGLSANRFAPRCESGRTKHSLDNAARGLPCRDQNARRG
jgi:hypothetical protein